MLCCPYCGRSVPSELLDHHADTCVLCQEQLSAADLLLLDRLQRAADRVAQASADLLAAVESEPGRE